MPMPAAVATTPRSPSEGQDRMPLPPFVVLLAVTVLVVVTTALCREVLVLRSWRRDLDRYLRWLMEDATGPLSLARPPRWF
jgi:hypothetical protein